MRDIRSLLDDVPIFKGMAPEHLDRIAGCAQNVKFDAGTVIAKEGQLTEHFYIIRHGRVAVDVFAPNKGASRIQTLGTNDMVGWSWLVPPYEWQFDITALEVTRAISFGCSCLRNKCEADSDLGYQLLKRFTQIMLKRLQATRLRLLDVYGKNHES